MRPLINLTKAVIVFILLTVPSCTRQFAHPTTIEQDLVNQAHKLTDSLSAHTNPVSYRADQPKLIRWELASLIPFNHSQGLLVPITYRSPLLMQSNFAGDQLFHVDYLTQLLFFRDSTGQPHAYVITAFPDSNYFNDPTRPFTGVKFIEDWAGNPLEKFLYTSDGQINRYHPNTPLAAAITSVTTCYTINGYNYSPATNETYSWSEPAGCSTSYYNDGSYSSLAPPSSSTPGAGGGSSTTTKPTVTVLPGNSVIKSISAYFNCFTNVGGSDHHYTVTVCVDQPDPGTRSPWGFTSGGSSGSTQANNVINTGHTFLILSESYPGTTITRNVGFYPSGMVMPSSPSSPGELNDDQNHYYNVSGTFTLDNAQFFNILNFMSSTSTATYNLNTNNCTTFAINAMAQAGIRLPSTTGTWPGGAGDDPGDLGQDMKNTIITGIALNSSPGYSPNNAGQCN